MDTPDDIKEISTAMVAVVDDERAVLESLADLLESAGYSVSSFESAKDFLESDVLPSVACLISDIRMPGMDGWELQSAVHARRPHLPVILITGHDESHDSRTRVAEGERHVLLLKKPFDAQRLLVAVAARVKESY